MCGESSETPLPDDPAAIAPDSEAAIQNIADIAGQVASCLRGAEVEARQACYLPVTQDGLPFIGR